MGDLQANLETYHLQLQQVEAALISDPTNDELIKLKSDLSEVIDLTKDLLSQQGSSCMDTEDGDEDDERESKWSVGDKCMAPWSQDSQYYEAIIEEIHSDGKVSIGFTEYSQGDITEMAKLKPYTAKAPKSPGAAEASGSSKRLPAKESLAQSHKDQPIQGPSIVGTTHQNSEDNEEEAKSSNNETCSKPPSLLDISPLQINHPASQLDTDSNLSVNSKNNNIPSLLSLNFSNKKEPRPVSLLSLNFGRGCRPPPPLGYESMAPGGVNSMNRNTYMAMPGRNHRIPSLFECRTMQSRFTVPPPFRHPLGNNFRPGFPRNPFPPPVIRHRSASPRFHNNVPIPSLLSPELAWMAEGFQEEIARIPRTSINGPPFRTKHYFSKK